MDTLTIDVLILTLPTPLYNLILYGRPEKHVSSDINYENTCTKLPRGPR